MGGNLQIMVHLLFSSFSHNTVGGTRGVRRVNLEKAFFFILVISTDASDQQGKQICNNYSCTSHGKRTTTFIVFRRRKQRCRSEKKKSADGVDCKWWCNRAGTRQALARAHQRVSQSPCRCQKEYGPHLAEAARQQTARCTLYGRGGIGLSLRSSGKRRIHVPRKRVPPCCVRAISQRGVRRSGNVPRARLHL
jgi:hypothetical protein